MSSATRQRGRQVALPEPAAVLLLGHREVDDRVEAAHEGLVDVGAQVRGQDRQAVEPLHPLEQVGDLDVGVAVAGVLDLGPLAEQRVGLVEQQEPLTRSASVKIRSRFFSVSPMYLSTTVERSMTYRSRPRSPATTSADIVLPVPESPANSAVTPSAAGALACPCRHSPRTRSRCRARAVSSRSWPRRRAAARGRPSPRTARSAAPAARGRRRSGRARRADTSATVIGRPAAVAALARRARRPVDLLGREAERDRRRGGVEAAPARRSLSDRGPQLVAQRRPSGPARRRRAAARATSRGPSRGRRPGAPGPAARRTRARRRRRARPASRPARRPGRRRAAAPRATPRRRSRRVVAGDRRVEVERDAPAGRAAPAPSSRASARTRPGARAGTRGACPAASPRATAVDLVERRPATDVASSASMTGSGLSSPSRCAVTRSGTRSEPRQERPVGVLDEQQAPGDERRQRAEPGAGGRGRRQRRAVPPRSSSARPTLARRRETSSWR